MFAPAYVYESFEKNEFSPASSSIFTEKPKDISFLTVSGVADTRFSKSSVSFTIAIFIGYILVLKWRAKINTYNYILQVFIYFMIMVVCFFFIIYILNISYFISKIYKEIEKKYLIDLFETKNEQEASIILSNLKNPFGIIM